MEVKGLAVKYREIFAKRFAQLRKSRGVTLQELGDALGITNQAVSYYETGKQLPRFEILCGIADYFGVSLDYLVGRSDRDEIES